MMASRWILKLLSAKARRSGQSYKFTICVPVPLITHQYSAVIPIAAYAFVGVEIISAAAIEVRTPKNNLPTPANYIAPVTGLIYMLLLLMFCFNVHWQDPGLPPFYGIAAIDRQNTLQRKDPEYVPISSSTVHPIMVLAVQHAGIETLDDFLMAALIVTAYNTAIVALYVASRTLHGITRDMDFNSEFLVKRWIAYLGVTNCQHVPSVAVLASAATFGSWLPALHFAQARHSISDVSLNVSYLSNRYLTFWFKFQQILSTIGTSGCVFVWASQCLAFIRYRKWSVLLHI